MTSGAYLFTTICSLSHLACCSKTPTPPEHTCRVHAGSAENLSPRVHAPNLLLLQITSDTVKSTHMKFGNHRNESVLNALVNLTQKVQQHSNSTVREAFFESAHSHARSTGRNQSRAQALAAIEPAIWTVSKDSHKRSMTNRRQSHTRSTAKFWLPICFIGVLFPCVVHSSRGLSYAFGATLIFGVNNFLLALNAAPEEPLVAEAYIVWFFIFTGCFALGLHIFFWATDHDYVHDLKGCVKLDLKANLSVISAAISVAVAQVASQRGFGMDSVASGPHTSVQCAECLLVAVFFAAYFREVLSIFQIVGIFAVMIGIAAMGFDGTPQTHLALIFMAVAMCACACETIFIRLGVLWGMKSKPGIVLRIGATGACGLLWLLFRYADLHEVASPGIWLVDPLANAVAECIGVAFVILCFEAPDCCTTVNSAIFNANSIIVCILNRVALKYMLNLQIYTGMTFVCIGSAVCAF